MKLHATRQAAVAKLEVAWRSMHFSFSNFLQGSFCSRVLSWSCEDWSSGARTNYFPGDPQRSKAKIIKSPTLSFLLQRTRCQLSAYIASSSVKSRDKNPCMNDFHIPTTKARMKVAYIVMVLNVDDNICWCLM